MLSSVSRLTLMEMDRLAACAQLINTMLDTSECQTLIVASLVGVLCAWF